MIIKYSEDKMENADEFEMLLESFGGKTQCDALLAASIDLVRDLSNDIDGINQIEELAWKAFEAKESIRLHNAFAALYQLLHDAHRIYSEKSNDNVYEDHTEIMNSLKMYLEIYAELFSNFQSNKSF